LIIKVTTVAAMIVKMIAVIRAFLPLFRKIFLNAFVNIYIKLRAWRPAPTSLVHNLIIANFDYITGRKIMSEFFIE